MSNTKMKLLFFPLLASLNSCVLHLSVFCEGTNQDNFVLFTPLKCSCDPVCVMSEPVKAFNVQSQGQCVMECKRQKCEPCVGVNFRQQNYVCELFSNVTNLSDFSNTETGCQYIGLQVINTYRYSFCVNILRPFFCVLLV